MDGITAFLPFVLIIAVFWLLIVRPQRKRQQELRNTQSALGVGSEVMLGSGLYGTVASLEDDTLHLELSPGTRVKVARQAVVRVVEPAVTEPDPSSDLSDGTEAEPSRDPDGDERPGTSGPQQ